MDLRFSEDDRRFQDEVKAFLEEHLPAELRHHGWLTPGAFAQADDWLAWQRILHQKGWLTYNWPVETGGTGWSPIQRYLFERECAVAHAPPLAAQGLRMLAPVLARFGTQAQKDHYLPKILSGEHIWCQGYSEPEAGSDLASLQCRAAKSGDQYIVNGSKIWTTNAHISSHIFCLVRTDTEAKRQRGISFLLIDMNTPGISVEPIALISGDQELNQVFFDDVAVPDTNLVGEENDGWTIAKFLLEHERGGSCMAPGMLVAIEDLRQAAKELPGRDGSPLAEDHDFMHRLSMVQLQAQGLEMLELRLLSQLQNSNSPGPESASVGLLVANILQAIDALALEAQGHSGLELVAERPVAQYAQLAMPKYLNNRAWSIMAGSNEVMRTIIASTVLGLPAR